MNRFMILKQPSIGPFFARNVFVLVVVNISTQLPNKNCIPVENLIVTNDLSSIMMLRPFIRLTHRSLPRDPSTYSIIINNETQPS